jgi:hypothetical protein
MKLILDPALLVQQDEPGYHVLHCRAFELEKMPFSDADTHESFLVITSQRAMSCLFGSCE